MLPVPFAVLLLIGAYLIGAIPFGYLIAKAKGVDLFKVGSGNIGATNVGRMLGRKWGILVFLLDFLKGAVPVALVPTMLRSLSPDEIAALGTPDLLRVGVALAAFLGHILPVYLGFRGGKGVATGIGTMFVLVPGPAAIAILIWFSCLAAFRMVSLGSVVAVLALCIARLLSITNPLNEQNGVVTIYCFIGAVVVLVKHRGNLKRIIQGSESRIEARKTMDTLARTLHVLAVSLWMGSAIFFSFIAAPAIFESFKEVVYSAPSLRTAEVPIAAGLSDTAKDVLASALAGAAVGPIFPKFFALHALCGAVALITALSWWRCPGKMNRWRAWLAAGAFALVVVGWPISRYVAFLRIEHFRADAAVAEAAKARFVAWHLVSLGLSALMSLLTLAISVLSARLPEPEKDAVSQ